MEKKKVRRQYWYIHIEAHKVGGSWILTRNHAMCILPYSTASHRVQSSSEIIYQVSMTILSIQRQEPSIRLTSLSFTNMEFEILGRIIADDYSDALWVSKHCGSADDGVSYYHEYIKEFSRYKKQK